MNTLNKNMENAVQTHNELKQTIVQADKKNEKEKELIPEVLNHYSFTINDLALNRFNLSKEQLNNFRMLLLTGLAEEIAKEMNDDWLIVHGKDKHVVLYDKNHATKENKDDLIKYYLNSDRVPEDILYLGDEGIEMYSRNVQKIEKHKARLEILTENIEVLIEDLKKIERETNSGEDNEIIKIEMIYNYIKREKVKCLELEKQENSQQITQDMTVKVKPV